MASQINPLIAMAMGRVANGRKVIGRQRWVIHIKQQAGLDVVTSLNLLANMEKSQVLLENHWEQLLRKEDRR
jgi:hypothetical protein